MERLPVSVRNQMDSVEIEVGVDKSARLTIVPNFVLFVKSDIRVNIAKGTTDPRIEFYLPK